MVSRGWGWLILITGENYIKDGVYYGACGLCGNSTDSKPMSYGHGSTYFEVDTGKIYKYDAVNEEWVSFEDWINFIPVDESGD